MTMTGKTPSLVIVVQGGSGADDGSLFTMLKPIIISGTNDQLQNNLSLRRSSITELDSVNRHGAT
jgi:hypothetical protein